MDRNKRIIIALTILVIIIPIIWFVEYLPAICLPNQFCADLNDNGNTSFAEQIKAWELRPRG